MTVNIVDLSDGQNNSCYVRESGLTGIWNGLWSNKIIMVTFMFIYRQDIRESARVNYRYGWRLRYLHSPSGVLDLHTHHIYKLPFI